MNRWVVLSVILLLSTACSDDATSNNANNGGNNGNNGGNNGNNGVSTTWTGSVDGAAASGSNKLVNVQEDNTAFQLEGAAGSNFSFISILADDVGYESTGEFPAVNGLINGGDYDNCGFGRTDESTITVTIVSIEKPAQAGLSPPHSKGSFTGTLTCEGGEPFEVQGSWDY